METKDLNTKEENTWCPGCPDFSILESTKRALVELANENKIEIKNTAIVTGIGCHAKIFDYLNLNSFSGLHGRVLPIALGIKIGNPKLTVIGFGGDGDTYSEGMEHFIHNCRYNSDMTMIVNDNQVFALTVGQSTPTSEKGPLKPLNPIALALTAGAGFVARGSALDLEHLKNLIKEAVLYKGFAFLEILQPCIVFHNTVPFFQKNIYKLDEARDLTNSKEAMERAEEWDYCFDRDQKIPIGIFYKKERPVFEEQLPHNTWHTQKRQADWQNLTKDFH